MGIVFQLSLAQYLSSYPTEPFARSSIEGVLIIANFFLFTFAVSFSLSDLQPSNLTIAFLISVLLILLLVLSPFPKTYAGGSIQSKTYLSILINRSKMRFSFFGQWMLLVQLLLAFLFTLSLSASTGINDAKSGRKALGGYMQKVFLASPQPLNFLDDLKQSCNASNNCIYGPFGFINENANSFHLIKWTKENTDPHTKIFSRTPGLFVLPRNDPKGSYIIIPASVVENPQSEIPISKWNFTQVLNKLLRSFQDLYQSLTNRK
jgi:hypothetical protein